MDEKTFYETLPKKRMGTAALFFDRGEKILIVKPNYRPDWLFPGGIVDPDESPLSACKREVLEELGLSIPITRLLCVDYKGQDGLKTESLQFIFYGGVLSEEEIASIRLQEAELIEYRFATYDEARELLSTRLTAALPLALKALTQQGAIYHEF
ncbi:NUDIX domain-containing protein [Ktedonobacter racemifer]|uniref:NUDIX hydrolase n=1 Tax=Ktedonobacter racemifer DSM 44963 TaxID=485913 RepID=D6TNR8_KTERA|nr:NUDIX hydrolase [Ktedonobacter racemifer]EFH85454.1 NUDIX hydrolase [Ktedonobacter racemifer DSM 44963]